MTDQEYGTIKFFQACLPPLFPGDYNVRVDQTVQQIRPEPFRTDLDFSVAGPRFSLNPLDIYSVYPPANQKGNFSNSLPHIVFTRRTLPWERTMDGTEPDNENPCPWLALVLLGDSDFKEGKISEIKTRKVGELLNPAKEDNTKGPDLTESDLNEYESTDDLCNTIDIPTDVFSKIVPAKADLPYLAHVREVHTGNKETFSILSDGCYSVVLGNRFPETTKKMEGIKNTAYLVSLEGYQNNLYQESGKITEKKIRLAVLATWSFICQGEADLFKVSMYNLDSGLLRLPISQETRKDAAAGKDGAKPVAETFEMGYTALNHHVRNGEKTVSWYRGPLVPFHYRKVETYRFLPCADAALRYNYETGLLDASYASAWQLGRLLALQDPHFSRAIYKFRNQARQKTKSCMEQERLEKKYQLSGKDFESHVVQAISSESGQKSLEAMSGLTTI
jgi:hypothetical protein